MNRKMAAFPVILLLTILAVPLAGCSNPKDGDDVDEAVTITDEGTHFNVVINYSSGLSRRKLGKAYGEAILEAYPSFEETVDEYLGLYCPTEADYQEGLRRIEILRENIPTEYREELEGLADACSGGSDNTLGDGKLSEDEVFILTLLTDVIRGTECSGVGAYGNATDDGQPMVARLLDWNDGDGLLNGLAAVTTLRQGSKSLCLIGYLGHLGMLSAVNDDGVFAGILDSGTGQPYSVEGKRSYVMDLRWAMEQYSSLDEVAAYLTDASRGYCYNHNVLMADEDSVAVLENNISGTGDDMHRALRHDDSALNPGVSWDHDDAICVVNSFVLDGNHDNHTGYSWNRNRWQSYNDGITASGATVNLDELKAMATDSDVFGSACQFLIIFQPATMKLEVLFKPVGGGTGSFVPITLDFF